MKNKSTGRLLRDGILVAALLSGALPTLATGISDEKSDETRSKYPEWDRAALSFGGNVVGLNSSVAFGARGTTTVSINAESLLGQIIALEDKKITAEEVQFIIGSVSEKLTTDFIDAVLAKNLRLAFEKIITLREAGIDFKNFGKTLLQYFRQMLILKINPSLGKKLSYEITPERLARINKQVEGIEINEILELINTLQENIEKFKNSPISQLYLEVSLAKIIRRHPAPAENPDAVLPPERKESDSSKNAKQPSGNNIHTSLRSQSFVDENEKSDVHEKNEDASHGKPAATGDDLNLVISRWLDINESLKGYNHSLASVLRMSEPLLIEGKYLILRTKYSFYNDKIVENQNRLTIENVIDKLTGVQLKIKALTEKEFATQYPDFKQEKSLLQEAVDIFGGKLVN